MSDNEMLQAIYNNMLGMKDDIQGMKDDIQGMKDDIQGMKDDIQGMKDDIQGMKDDIQGMKDDIQGMKKDIQDIKTRVTSIEMTLENETNKNIMVVAEGHIDLSRKLDECIKTSSSVDSKLEIHKLYINKHESDINKIIQRIAQGA